MYAKFKMTIEKWDIVCYNLSRGEDMIIKFTPGNKKPDGVKFSSGVIRTEQLAPDLESLPEYLKRFLHWPTLDYDKVDVDEIEFADTQDFIDFNIVYIPRQHCEIRVYRGEEDLLNELASAIGPLMWGPLPDADNKQGYCAPILQFDEDEYCSLVYDTYRPEQYLKNMLEQHFSGIRPLENIKVMYPDFDISVYDKAYKYGEYCPYSPTLNPDYIDYMSESEIAYSIWYLRGLERHLRNNFEITDIVKRRIRYTEAYFFQKTADFGVEPDAPSIKYKKPNYECEVWYKWWADGFKKFMKEHPKEFDDWCQRAVIGEPCPFRPEGDYVDLLQKGIK